jgi:CheY-like chemotaxis protein
VVVRWDRGEGTLLTTAALEPLVLFAEDHDDTRTMYAEFFADNGFRTADAADGVTAVALIKALRPDVIVLDIRMPRLDGIRALKVIRNQPQLRDTPILVLTSFDFYETEAVAAGATAVCVKPCTPDELLKEVRALLSRKGNR